MGKLSASDKAESKKRASHNGIKGTISISKCGPSFLVPLPGTRSANGFLHMFMQREYHIICHLKINLTTHLAKGEFKPVRAP